MKGEDVADSPSGSIKVLTRIMKMISGAVMASAINIATIAVKAIN